jgi:uncharacterized LabA/DUF88 family protein
MFGEAVPYKPVIASLAEGRFQKVFYYDAIPGREHGEEEANYQERVRPFYESFDTIRSLDRVHVELGNIVGKERRQKGVDVKLAVDMLTHAFRGNITRATLFAGDADFEPLIHALVNEGLHTTLWHPPQASKGLKSAADSTVLFNFKDHHRCFSIDGEKPAFGNVSMGGGPENGTFRHTTHVDATGRTFSGVWSNDHLSVQRKTDPKKPMWEYVKFHAPGSSLEQALLAFDAVHEWGIAEEGVQWL